MVIMICHHLAVLVCRDVLFALSFLLLTSFAVFAIQQLSSLIHFLNI